MKYYSNLFELLKKSCQKYQDNYFFIDKYNKKTYQEFFNDVIFCFQKCEQYFRKEKVLICAKNSYEWIIAYFAVVISGGIAVLVQDNTDSDKLASICFDYEIKIIICDQKKDELIDLPVEIITTDSLLTDFVEIGSVAKQNLSVKFTDLKADDVCTIAFTSGTTDESKGVMVTHRNLCADAQGGGLGTGGTSPRDFILAVLPFSHLLGLTLPVLISILSGSKIAVSSFSEFFQNLATYAPNLIYITPELAKIILNKIKEVGLTTATGGKLERIGCGGAMIDDEIIKDYQKLGITLSLGYGGTECSPLVTVNNVENVKIGTSGTAIHCNEIKIADNGEILVKGDNVMAGYYGNPDLTKEVIVDGWFHTGDLGKLEDGYLIVTGRIKNLIVFPSGQKVSPEEIEAKLNQSPQIDESLISQNGNHLQAKIFSQALLDQRITKADLEQTITKINKKLATHEKITKISLTDAPLEKSSNTNKIKRTVNIG